MDNTNDQQKKCFCARCFLPVDSEDKVDIEGQNFHRICSMCCICRTVPPSLKMFYGHVFCNECFKTHVLSRFKGESPRIHSNSWWMQWAPGAKAQDRSSDGNNGGDKPETSSEEAIKRCICSRCLQVVDENNKIDIGNQSFHTQCAKCCFCNNVPATSPRIYYGQVFCEECFHRHVLNRNKDNPSEFFKQCFEQWQNNGQFAEHMREFMTGNKDNVPFVFMMQGQQPPFCRCGTGPQEWHQSNEPRKSATPTSLSIAEESLNDWDLSFENQMEVPKILESHNAINESAIAVVSVAEKIEKLTKYLHYDSDQSEKKWENFQLKPMASLSLYGWVDLQPKSKKSECPKCLWQCGTIYVNSEFLQKQAFCGEVSFE